MTTTSGAGDRDEDWRRAGFTPEQVASFREWRIDLEAASTWRQVGVTSGLDATRWTIARVPPHQVPDWRKAGIGLDDAFRWRRAGFSISEARRHIDDGTTPEEARGQRQAAVQLSPSIRGPGAMHAGLLQRAQAAGVDMTLLHGYIERQWIDDDAIEWASYGIGAADAYHWVDIGLTAREAAGLTETGATPVEALRRWWTTAIPFDELAEWIGAGLNPEEAVAQRAAGVTTDQAAALRALQGSADEANAARPGQNQAADRWGPPRRGQPPADEAAARQQVVDAFAAMTEVDEATGAIPAVERGEDLGACLEEALSHLPPSGVVASTPVTTTITVDRLKFLNDHEAIVSYTINVTGGFNINLTGRPGRAKLIDRRRWTVARDTFCDLMAAAGVTCPPPP